MQIVETVIDADGAQRRRESLGLLFNEHETATAFVWTHLARAFADGRYGYHPADEVWWGCDHGRELLLYQYRIEH